MKSFEFHGKQAIINCKGEICDSSKDLLSSELFKEVLKRFLDELNVKGSHFLNIFPKNTGKLEQNRLILKLLLELSENRREKAMENKQLAVFFNDIYLLHQFVEKLYNFWRSYERFMVIYSEDGSKSLDKTAWTTFSKTIEKLNHIVRKLYRDICRNITKERLSVYRQMPAGCQVGTIVTKKDWVCKCEPYTKLKDIHFIRQILIEPPLLIDPPMNKRSGQFTRVDKNPLDKIKINEDDWLCYPAKVGDLVIYLFFNKTFINLGTAVINLFDMVPDDELDKAPDAVYLYGVPEEYMEHYKEKTVFYDDKENDLLIGACPSNEKYGYFGYVKKMMLTLHNIIVMKRGRLPVHGAMVRVEMKNGKNANVIIMGDTGTGKSESLEAFRIIGEKYIHDMTIIFDDMGSLEITEDGKIKAYGTETGAFVRLDDLQLGYTLGNVDRSIIMSPQKINARAVLPITTLQEVLHGYSVDYFMYANNYERVDSSKKYLEEFKDVNEAIKVFREGKRMAKGTTTETGLVCAYFANIFGPVQYKEMHDKLADKYFAALFRTGTIVGQIRTQLGIKGFESNGPEHAAEALFKEICKR